MGRVSGGGNHLVISMEHDTGTNRVEAEQRYLQYRTVFALEKISVILETLLWAMFLGCIMYVLAEVAVNLLHKGDA